MFRDFAALAVVTALVCSGGGDAAPLVDAPSVPITGRSASNLTGDHICMVVEKFMKTTLERYNQVDRAARNSAQCEFLQSVELETYVSCNDPFSGFRCKEKKPGSRISYKSAPKLVEEEVARCCEGYRETANNTCEPSPAASQLVSDGTAKYGGITASLVFIVALLAGLVFYYKRKSAGKKQEHRVKCSSKNGDESDDEELHNRVFRPAFVQPASAIMRPSNDDLKPGKPIDESMAPHNEYVQLGGAADDSPQKPSTSAGARESIAYETIPMPGARVSQLTSSFDNPNSSMQPLISRT